MNNLKAARIFRGIERSLFYDYRNETKTGMAKRCIFYVGLETNFDKCNDNVLTYSGKSGIFEKRR